MHTRSTYSTHAAFFGSIHSVERGNTLDLRREPISKSHTGNGGDTYETRRSFSCCENTCASSAGGPGLKSGDEMAGKSRFGTVCSKQFRRGELVDVRETSMLNLTYPPVIWRLPIRFCYFGFDAADNCRVAQSHQCRTIGGRNRAWKEASTANW